MGIVRAETNDVCTADQLYKTLPWTRLKLVASQVWHPEFHGFEGIVRVETNDVCNADQLYKTRSHRCGTRNSMGSIRTTSKSTCRDLTKIGIGVSRPDLDGSRPVRVGTVSTDEARPAGTHGQFRVQLELLCLLKPQKHLRGWTHYF